MQALPHEPISAHLNREDGMMMTKIRTIAALLCIALGADIGGVLLAASFTAGDSGGTKPGLIIHLSATGNDANVGSEQKPLASFEGARDRIRTIKAKKGLPDGGVVVLVRETFGSGSRQTAQAYVWRLKFIRISISCFESTNSHKQKNGTGELKESQMITGLFLPTDQNPPVSVQPTVGSLHHPAASFKSSLADDRLCLFSTRLDMRDIVEFS